MHHAKFCWIFVFFLSFFKRKINSFYSYVCVVRSHPQMVRVFVVVDSIKMGWHHFFIVVVVAFDHWPKQRDNKMDHLLIEQQDTRIKVVPIALLRSPWILDNLGNEYSTQHRSNRYTLKNVQNHVIGYGTHPLTAIIAFFAFRKSSQSEADTIDVICFVFSSEICCCL